jgi:anti-sigma regulatory factor (Ser/Thr protein kinase)
VAETVRRRFEADPQSVREARRFVRETISSRATGAESAEDDLVLALSEMATNAVLHAGTPFEVVVTTDGFVRIEVEDESTEAPVRRSPSDGALGGRGLQIIEDVCDRWGVHVVRDRKCVWCERDL